MSKVKYYSGEDLIYQVTLNDGDGNPVNFADVIDMEVQFINPYQKKIVKTKADGGIIQGSSANIYKVELQESETLTLGAGNIDIKITITTPNSGFSDAKATSIIEDNFTLL